ncbi:MAG: glycine cleavage system protein GcvH [Dehalococcoidia bacterium]|nr:MAG: glycine cleavage system protein GcvH [Dehalococcoidia bacterium]
MHPNELLYSPDHIWCKKEPDGNVRLGMTYHYQEQLKNIVYVDLPKVGTLLQHGEPFASFESSKTAADLTCPISGSVIETNAQLQDKPGLVNKDPYGQGWMVLVKPTHPEELDLLLSSKEYIDLILK